ncbi:E3 ubiquitin-protein ligase RING1-like isoform X2 [Histomonas meleagridis]|uniref:E3 ubiquitin-protein ligase RING1-like isoform X2 n=1 Tax=Histomonas meleagridis TaxID=135588 RepID=UPI00355A5D82|nr:E3 ubiquitin-protein ligase RING1-like isoform X2 [Histomonas meleagridis]KAH0796884.1 E3 ubiquitin-protein ligase RING1-like isoform X2 [Histomonas meleagridis]
MEQNQPICWCFKCNKRIKATREFTCPFCNDDYIEIEENQNLPYESPAPQPISFSFNLPIGEIMRTLTTPPANGQPPNLVSTIMNMAQTILSNITRNTGNAVGSVGDYFFGNEEQLRLLADRLFQMSQQSLGSPPATESFINSLQPVRYGDSDCVEDTCSICLDHFEEDTEIVLLPCRHGFHQNCITQWLKLHSECPSCRHKLPST